MTRSSLRDAIRFLAAVRLEDELGHLDNGQLRLSFDGGSFGRVRRKCLRDTFDQKTSLTIGPITRVRLAEAAIHVKAGLERHSLLLSLLLVLLT